MAQTRMPAGEASGCTDEDAEALLSMQITAALMEEQEEYAVALPEKLTPDGPWLVRRHVVALFRSDVLADVIAVSWLLAAVDPWVYKRYFCGIHTTQSITNNRHRRAMTKLVTTYAAPGDHIHTLYDNLEHSIKLYPNIPYLGIRELLPDGKRGQYKWQTYAEVADVRSAIGSGLLYHGIAPGSSVGIYSVNRPEWCIVDAACHAYSLVTVPLYDTLGPDSVEYICNHAELAAVACSVECLATLVKCLPKCPTVKLVVVYGLRTGQWLPAELPRNLTALVITYEELHTIGGRHPRPHLPPRGDALATICYTSGTTGVPKGAMLTQANLIANSAGYINLLDTQPDQPGLLPGEVHCSWLPLGHIYERVNLITATHLGCSVGFYSGDVLMLLEDLQLLRPHLFPAVPRLWNRIYDRVRATIEQGNPLARRLFAAAYAQKQAALRAGDLSGGRMGPFWDRLVFSKIAARLGGRAKYLITGASPLAPEVFEFMRICFGATVLEGYGMTETACTITLTDPGDATMGHVGVPTMSCEVKLEDIPEMNYYNSDTPYPRGEVCVRGPIVFQGYYKAEEQTREVLDADGWMHTGDVGMWLPGGRLKIIDRKKNIFKLAQGEYIAPEKIENVYTACQMVAQVFVYGNSLRHQLVGIVVPDPEVLLPWAAQQGKTADLTSLCADPGVRKVILDAMLKEGRSAGLKGFEQVAAIVLVPDLFSIDNGLLTPTFKLKRPQAQACFQQEIDAMYAALGSGM